MTLLAIFFKLSSDYDLQGFSHLPRQDFESGSIKEYTIEVSEDGNSWDEVVTSQFPDSKKEIIVEFDEVTAQFVKIKINSTYNIDDKVSLADFNLYGTDTPTSVSLSHSGVRQQPQGVILGNELALTGFTTGQTKVEIFSVSGRLLMSKSLTLTTAGARIPLSNSLRGVMILRIHSGGTNITQKLIR